MYDPHSPLLRSSVAPDGLPQPEAKARFAEDRLLDAVIWCEVLPGETVTEADVMDRFGLTRAAARAALTRLGYDGWASPQARLGWQILPVTGALVGQVLTARRMVEPTALAAAPLTRTQRDHVARIGDILRAMQDQNTGGAVVAFRHFVDEIDSHLLGAIDPFSARHLRKLWHHSARMVRYLEDAGAGHMFRRAEIFDLVQAVVDADADGIARARHALIDAQERFVLHQMLKSEAALGPGSGLGASRKQAAAQGRPS
ncbi:GntR family transcriptional regulator [Tropicibacter alexandrii]|uniref:GntR family transcriptional regulator n=1 Tax=Tropicibacter alexandrii TaxID=2267683 RepID=UPI000EF4DD20|nr:GntR family transcriptional regulator [Tropicibacter alexandrii]